MTSDPGRPFATFSAAASESREPRNTIIRRARRDDIDGLARLAAERDGDTVAIHAASFESAIARAETERSSLVLAADIDSHVVGFSKARYLGARDLPAGDPAPEGWYLTGVVVDPAFRRLGAGFALTTERLRWIAERADVAYYFANARNRVSLALHERFGFVEIARGSTFAGVSFTGGEGILFRVDLPAALSAATSSANSR